MKRVLVIGVAIIILITCVMINHNMTVKAINTCIESGNDPKMCKITLR